jgi:hypothetical protein
MDDVKEPIESVEEQTVAPVEQPSQVAEEETPEVQSLPQVERQVPLKELIEERKKRQEISRELAQLKTGNQMSKYDPNDLETIMQHPMVQELILKDAKRELNDYTRDLLGQYPTVPELVKKAMLKNVRGFVNENTADVETAKIDILEYVEALAAETTPAPVQKGFPVAATNLPTTESSTANSNEVNKILNKPVDEWSKEEEAALGEFAKRTQK